MLFCIIVFCATSDIRNVEWKGYLGKNEGRRKFQINLALSIMNYGLSLDWDGDPAKRPDYVRGDAFTPCDCGNFFASMVSPVVLPMRASRGRPSSITSAAAVR